MDACAYIHIYIYINMHIYLYMPKVDMGIPFYIYYSFNSIL